MRRFVLIIFGLIFVANLVCWRSFDFILAQLLAPEFLRRGLATFLLLQVVGMTVMIGARLLKYQPGTGMGRPLLSLVMIWNLLLALPTAVASFLWAGAWWILSGRHGNIDPESPGRTVGLIAVSLPFAATFIGTAVSIWQLGRFRVHRVKLTLPHLPAALKGFTIVHLSDLHIGKLTRGKVLEDLVAATNHLDSDLILLTGDLINMSLDDLPQAFELLRALKSRHGLFLCEGNHDLIESRTGFETMARKSGLRFLLNESAELSVRGQRVQILGLRWGEGMERGQETPAVLPADPLHRLLAAREPGDFVILLAHDPNAFDAAVQAEIPLTLAGHTHGGQLMLTRKIGFGPWFFRYWSGVYEQGASRMIVSNGAGNWFPLRIHAPAEIIHLTLD
jgi:predicted MPP superfamily phosphohydrolase